MKKITIIFTLSLITLLSLASFMFFKCYITHYKTEFKSYIFNNKDNIITSKIVISDNELYTNSPNIVWEDENKEVVFKGKLYDIVSIQKNNTIVELTVVSDEQEAELKKEYASIYNNSLSKKSNNPIQLIKQLLAFKYLNAYLSFTFDSLINTNSGFINYQFALVNNYLPVETPPPNFL